MVAAETNPHNSREATVLAEAEALVQRASDVRTRLEAEREAHRAAIRRIDDVLARLPKTESDGAHVRVGGMNAGTLQDFFFSPADEKRLKAGSIPDLLLQIISSAPGIGSAAIIETAQATRKKLEARVVHSALWRLQTQKRLRVEGKKGSRTYFVAEPEEVSAP